MDLKNARGGKAVGSELGVEGFQVHAVRSSSLDNVQAGQRVHGVHEGLPRRTLVRGLGYITGYTGPSAFQAQAPKSAPWSTPGGPRD